MSKAGLETFPALCARTELAHGMTLRHPTIPTDCEKAVALERLRPHYRSGIESLGYSFGDLVSAQQVHGADVALVGPQHRGEEVEGVDGLVSLGEDLLLGIYVADCCAVFLVDKGSGAIGLVHAGRRGTEKGIVERAIDLMVASFGTQPANLTIQLSPCIRPPDYEEDFAAGIRRQCLERGVPSDQVHDEGISTASAPDKYYSYRMEKGRTGRMLALLGRRR